MNGRRLIAATIVLAAIFLLAAPRSAEGSWSVSISYFHEQLSPYGQWVVAGSYGHCWVPAGIHAAWAPYTDGEWIWSDYGWTWVSYDPWGDIPFHYGTWAWADPYGWVWVPGTIWAPAWVTWAYTDSYVGWAPLPPSFVLTAGGYSGGPVIASRSRYCFVPVNQFVGVSVSTSRVPTQQNATIFAQATKTTSFAVSSGIVRTNGPPPARIERVTGKRLVAASIERAKTKPTTLTASGSSHRNTWSVTAPAQERARVIKATAAKPEKSAAAAARPEKVKVAAAPKHEKVAAEPQHQKVAVAPKHEKVAAEPQHQKVAVAPKHEKVAAEPQHQKVAAAPKHEKVAAAPKHEQAQPPPKTAERREDARVAHNPPTHEQPQPQVAGPAAPAAQPAPGQVKKEQAPKEKGKKEKEKE